jgi:hypothetical protein
MTQPPQQPQYQMQPVIPGSAMGTASLVLGILALFTFCVPVLGVVAIILGVVSIAQASGAPTGKAKSGLILGLISIVGAFPFWGVVHYGAKKGVNALQQEVQKAEDEAKKQQQQLEDATKKQQEQMQKMNMPMTQPGVMLNHPEGWSVYIA